MNLQELYKIAKLHKDTHRGCGAEPYLDYEYLYNFVAKISNLSTTLPKGGGHEVPGDFCILELGTGIGFTSLVMHIANHKAEIDTIETHGEHLEIAKVWFKEIQKKTEGNPRLFLGNINIIQADVHKVLPYLDTNK